MTGKIVLLDKAFVTEFGELKALVYMEDVVGDIEKYKSALKTWRGIPFDMETVTSADPLCLLASSQMDWATPEEVVAMVKNHYDKLDKDADIDASVLAMTKATKSLAFEPEPWDEPEQGEEWEFTLPTPVRNLRYPLERRLKQIYDMIRSDSKVYMEFMSALNVMFIETERRTRELDADGFRSGRTRRGISTPTRTNGKGSKRGSVSSLAAVHESDGSTEHADARGDLRGQAEVSEDN